MNRTRNDGLDGLAREQPLWALVRPYARSHRARLATMSAAAVVGGFAEAAVLLIVARVAIALSAGDDTITASLGPLPTVHASVWAVLGVAAGLLALRIGLQTVQNLLATRSMTDIIKRTRKALIHQYLGASWAIQSAEREGRLQQLLTSYVSACSNAVMALAQGAIAAFNLCALLIAAFAISAVASLGAAFAALAIGVLLAPLRAAVRRRSTLEAEADLTFATGVTELASTLQEVRIFGVEGAVSHRLDALVDRTSDLSRRRMNLANGIGILYTAFAMLVILAALGVAYATSVTELGALGAVVLIMIRSLSYAQGVQGAVQGLHQAAPYLQTLEQERGRYAAAAMPRSGADLAGIGEVEFDRVSFSYEPGVPVLRDVSFSAKQGEIVGIVGPSGAGKSTLVQLLLRLRVPTDGRILVGGRPVEEFSLDRWYDHVTFVSQDTRMFAGTVTDNIRFFRDADEAAIVAAAKLAHLHDEIVSWPRGYETPVGERGGQLSGGQKQRLCIARALLDRPDVVVFDEPTSSLDVHSDALIRDTIQQVAADRLVFIVAHRLSTLTICDRIMVIMAGELQGFDTSDCLEASNPFYREALRLSGMR